MSRLWSLWLVLSLVACTHIGSQGLSPQQHRVQAKALWAKQAASEYEMQVQQQCYCRAELNQPISLRVQDGEIVELIGLDKPIVQQEVAKGAIRTVQSLFDFIEWAQREYPAYIEVRYHPELGYPEYVDFKGHPRVADDELIFRIRSLRILTRQ